jgi:hypothetical protein
MKCGFCEHIYEDWKHILTCPGAGGTIDRNESFDSLKVEQKQFNVQDDIREAIDHGITFFNRNQERKDTPRNTPHFPRTLQPRKILMNDAFTAQSNTGWGHFLKGNISHTWGKILRQKRIRYDRSL